MTIRSISEPPAFRSRARAVARSLFRLGCLLGLVFAGVSCGKKSGLEIVRDGQPQAEIVLSADALSSVKVAAEDLQKTIELISGAKLPLVEAPTEGVKYQIYVGDSPLVRKLEVSPEGLPPEGFRIVVRDNFIALVGRDEQRTIFPYSSRIPGSIEKWREFSGQLSNPSRVSIGMMNRELGFQTMDATATFYAVSEFLEQIGVRWYAPYEDGTVIPEKKTIVIPGQDLTRSPKFPYREFNYYNTMQTDTEGVLWFKRMKFGASHAYCNDGHSTRNILLPEEMLRAHPEYYAKDANGKVISGHNGGVPKLTDPGFRQASAVSMEKMIEAYPSLKTVTVGMPDGFGVIDSEDAAIWVKPNPTPGGRFSDYVWDYWLDMAGRLKESHPDQYLNCYSYTTYTDPPSQVEKLPKNVALTMTYGVALSMLPIYTEGLAPLREKWLSKLTSGKFFIWEYCLFYRKNAPTVPVVFTKLLQKEMQRLNGVCEGKFIEIMPWDVEGKGKRIAFPELTHMIHYLQGKLYWDPDLDLAALLDEYYALYYGPAKAEMKEFYEFAEEVWTRPEDRSVTPTTGYLKRADGDRYFALLSLARAKVEPGSVYEKRISRLETEMNPLKTFFDRLSRSGPSFLGNLAAPPAELDGDLKKPFWETGEWYEMKDVVTGKPLPDQTRTRVAFRMSPDKKTLFVGVDCAEPRMEKLVSSASKHDDPAVFEDDAIEIYLESPERSFFRIGVNSAGLVSDESQDITTIQRDTLPLLWEPGIQAAIQKSPGGWTAEIAIPTADLGNVTLGPQKVHPWGVNVFRHRAAGEGKEGFALSPTGETRFDVLSKLGRLTFPTR